MDTFDLDKPNWIEETIKGVKLRVKVNPNSKDSSLKGSTALYLKVNVNSEPERGKANSEVESLFSNLLGLNESKVKVTEGLRSRKKTVLIEGESKELNDKLTNIVRER
ncbi:MAG: DUF167 domain-containing protein [archaeon]